MNTLKPCLLVAALWIVAASASAGDGCCDCCGCSANCYKVCVPKMTERTVNKVCWDVKCEDVCIPGRSCFCGEKCKEDKCGCWSFNVWLPTCAKVKTRHVPVKIEVKRKVPAVEWVVECRCDACCQKDGAQILNSAPQPPADSK